MTTRIKPRELQEDIEANSNYLEMLLSDLSTQTENCDLLREHLESARTYLLGAMPAEYQFSLSMAREASNCVSDPRLRRKITAFVDHQLQAYALTRNRDDG